MINHQQMHYDRHRGWQPIKARKLGVLEFIYDRKTVTAYDLTEQFGYTYSSARSRLSHLRKDGLIVPFGLGQWCLTDKAHGKLRYHGVLQRKEAEKLRRQRQAEGRVWFIDTGGRVRTAKNVNEMLLTFDEAITIARELRKEGLV